MKKIIISLGIVLFVSSCAYNDSKISEDIGNTDKLNLELERLNSSILAEIGASASRGGKPEQQEEKKDTTKVVLADVHGAVTGAMAGAEYGVWGAVIGGVINAVAESYLVSSLASIRDKDKKTDEALLLYDRFVKICDKALVGNIFFYTHKRLANYNPNNPNNSGNLVGVIHNAILDSLALYDEDKIDMIDKYELTEIDTTFYNNYRIFYEASIRDIMENDDIRYLVNVSQNFDTTFTSFKNIFIKNATSLSNAELIANSYENFVRNSMSFTDKQKSVFIYSMGVAKKSYEHWSNILKPNNNEE